MLRTKKEKELCSQLSSEGRCGVCPYFRGNLKLHDLRCRNTCRFDNRAKDWVYDRPGFRHREP